MHIFKFFNIQCCKNIQKVIYAHGISCLGNALYETIFTLFIVQKFTTHKESIGLVFMIKFMPYIFFGYLGGIMADRYNKKYMMLISDFIRLLTITLLLFTIFLDIVNIPILCLLSFFITLSRCGYQPSQQSIIVELAKDKKALSNANILVRSFEESGNIIGPILGSTLISIGGYSTALIINIVIYIVSIILILFTVYNFIKKEKIKTKITFKIPNFRHIKYLTKKYTLANTIYGSALCIFFISPILRFAIPIFIMEKIGLTQTIFGWIMSSIGLGTVFGSLLYKKYFLNKKNTMTYWSLYGLLLGSIFCIHTTYILFIVAILIGIVGAFIDISLVETIQQHTENKFLGRTFSFFSVLANSAESLAARFGSFLIAQITVVYAGISLGLMCSLIAIVFICYSFYNKRMRLTNRYKI